MLFRFPLSVRSLLLGSGIGFLLLTCSALGVQAQEIPQTVINQPCTACQPTDVHVADLDGDQDPDILSASAGDNKIAWYENLDSGGFSEQKTITTSATNASSVFAADIDGDQDLDVLAAHNTGDDEETQVAWYENLDSGGFSSANPLDTGGNQNAVSVFAADIDNDNDADVVVGFDSFNDDEVVWHENLDDGGLSAAKTVADGFDGSTSVYAANLDGDQDKDIISASAGDQIEWYENLDDAGFSSANSLNSDFLDPTGVHAADFDGDNDQDIVAVASAAISNVVWFENLDSGGFSSAKTNLSTSGDPSDVHVANVDADDNPDIIIADSFGDDVRWYENLDSGGFSDPKIVSDDARTAVAVTAANVDGDAATEILSASQFEDKIAWHENQLGGSGGFSSGTAVNVIPDAIRPSSVHTAALDDDGDQDVLYATFGDEFTIGKIAWHENVDGDGFGPQNAISTQVPGARSVVAADLDGDEDQDVLFGSSSSAGIGWFENLDSGGFSSTQNSLTSSVSAREVVAADLDGDDDNDVLYVSGDAVEWLENLDDGGFESSVNVKILTDGLIDARSVVATDIGSDGDQDVIAIGDGGFNNQGRQESGKLVWFENQGSGSFSSATTIDDDTDEGRSVSVADLDGDGDTDIVAGGGFGTKTVWYENLDDGGFSTRTEIGSEAKSVRTEDVNGDGAPDVLVTGGGRVEWIPNLGGGQFGKPDTLTTNVRNAQSVFSASLDGDGDADILSASFDDDKIAWYANDVSSILANQSASVGSNGEVEFGNTGTDINFSGVGGSGTVTVSKFGSAPVSAGDIAESNVSGYRFTVEADETLSIGSDTKIQFDVSTLSGLDNVTTNNGEASNVTVYRRSTEGSGSFKALTTTYNSSNNELIATTGRFSEFVLASDTAPLPVELTHFAATAGDGSARLTWTTASETNNSGFTVQHKMSENGSWNELGFVEGSGTTTEAQSYQFTAEELSVGTHRFHLQQVDVDGSTHLSKTVTVDLGMDQPVRLPPPAPHPVRQRATLSFAVKEAQETTIRLYNVLGQRVATLYRGTPAAEEAQTVDLSASDLSSGVYFVRLQAGGQTRTQKITVVR